ncbi:MAG TPA: site-2 protease family protein [Gammaproteobacteria bacterium]
MGGGLHLARVAGVDVYLDWSLLIIFALVTVSLGAGVLPLWHPEWGAVTVWLVAVAAAILFFLSVLTHELAHAVVGRRQGIDVPRITLFVFGGVAQLREEPKTWRGELVMAIVGPLTSLAIGAVCLALGSAIAGPIDVDPERPEQVFATLGPLATLLFWLGPVNIVLAVFNLVPGFPLDGGRVLRAALWGATGDLRRATRWASNAGQVFAWYLIGSGLAMVLGFSVPVFGRGGVSGLWLALIGWFLNNAAVQSYRQLLVREALTDVPVSRLMLTDVRVVSPDVSVQRFVDDYFLGSGQRAYPVVEGERLVGMACLRDVRKVPRADWDAKRVADIMTTKVAAVAPEDPASEALSELGRLGVNQLAVVVEGRVRGLLRREDILRWLALHGDFDLDRSSDRELGRA